MKSLPTLKHSKRYLAFSVKGAESEGRGEIKKAVFKTIMALLGECEASSANVHLISYTGGQGILVCNPEYVDKCIVALACMKKVNKVEVFVDVTGVFGMLEDAKKGARYG
jgi:RNase P/RNase MRP subunit POP5